MKQSIENKNFLNEIIVIPPNLTIDILISELIKYCNKKDLETIRTAYNFADKAHANQKRKSGEPYIIHPLSTAFILSTFRIDASLVVAALLHDVPEDTDVTIEEIESNFGSDVAKMVKAITKLSTIKYRGVERYIENLRKMFIAMSEDIRVMIIKFADRIHNLMTLDAMEPNKQYRIALESLEIYAPIANRLSMGEFKGMLEDLSFRYVDKKAYDRVKLLRKTVGTKDDRYLNKVITKIEKSLRHSGINAINIHGRNKKLYSLYKKLKQKDWDIDQIHDIVALRIIVPDISDCYATLGIIHKLWKPLRGRIKDYISQQKPNGYKSLHTTVFCEDGKWIEFQIKTSEMHDEAEFGIAAHWHYDANKNNSSTASVKNIPWAKELAQIQKEILNSLSDLDALKIDFFQNRIFVFTPQGDVIDLPENATPVDFAFNIHTEVGKKCNGALVNNQMVSLDTSLHSGDIVEIITDKNRKGPSRDWLKFVKTHVAKSNIKQSIKDRRQNWLKAILPPSKKK